jgi:hypothetical protein
MATWTQATAIPQGQLITAAWMSNIVNDVNLLGASGSSSRDFFYGIQQTSQTLSTANNFVTFGASSEIVDKANGHDTASQTTRYTIQAAGYYRVQAKIGTQLSSGTPSYIYSAIYKTVSGGSTPVIVPGSATYATVSTVRPIIAVLPAVIIQCAVGDYLQLLAKTDAGTIETTNGGGADGSTLLVEWVGAS